jgi:nucleotide-binding universal stress UspA family protein
MIDRMVVGVDGSSNARAALEWAIALAEQLSAELVVVHSVGLREGAAVRDEHDRAQLSSDFVQHWCAPLAASSVARRCLLADGDPVSVLLRVAGDERADLIVVGCRGISDRAELMLGSTSAQVTQRSVVPVVVVPAAPREPQVVRDAGGEA